MMHDLIKITTNERNEQLVDARELWIGLESKRKFADWVKDKVVNNPFFVENEDFLTIPNIVKRKEGVRGAAKQIDYALTIDTAKKVAMSEQTDRGNEVRDYFLKCEKKLKEVQNLLPSNYIDALKQLVISEEAKQKAIEDSRALLIENEVLKPKAEFYDDVASSSDAIELGKVSKILAVPGMGRNKLFEFLRDNNILMEDNIPFQAYSDRGYFRVIEQKYNKPDGSTHINIKTLVYQRGIDYILKLLKKRG